MGITLAAAPLSLVPAACPHGTHRAVPRTPPADIWARYRGVLGSSPTPALGFEWIEDGDTRKPPPPPPPSPNLTRKMCFVVAPARLLHPTVGILQGGMAEPQGLPPVRATPCYEHTLEPRATQRRERARSKNKHTTAKLKPRACSQYPSGMESGTELKTECTDSEFRGSLRPPI